MPDREHENSLFFQSNINFKLLLRVVYLKEKLFRICEIQAGDF